MSAYLSPMKLAAWMCSSTTGMAAGIQAIRDSGIEVTEANADRIGIIIGSGIGGLPMIEDTHNDFPRWRPAQDLALLHSGTIINMISGNLSIMFGHEGPISPWSPPAQPACTRSGMGAHDRLR